MFSVDIVMKSMRSIMAKENVEVLFGENRALAQMYLMEAREAWKNKTIKSIPKTAIRDKCFLFDNHPLVE